MKWLIHLALICSLATGGDSFCAHSMFVESASESATGSMHQTPSHKTAPHSDHTMAHASHSTSDTHAGHCPDGCEGGANCQGCSAAPSAILNSIDLASAPVPTPLQALILALTPRPFLPLDPPPPKHLS